MKLLIHLLLLIHIVFAYQTYKGVIVGDDTNFEQIIRTKGKYTFVNFYSETCEHCQSLGPRYEALATAFNGTSVQISQIEGRKNRRVRNEYGIMGFPVLRLYYFDGTHVDSYSNQERTTEQLARFLTERTGVKPHWPESKVTELSSSAEVDAVIAENKGRVVIGFTAPWLKSWTDRFNEYERLATKFSDVKFYKLDATAVQTAEIVSKYRVSVFPTLLYFDAIDAPKFRILEESSASENRMSMFLRSEIGDDYEDLDDLKEEKSAGAGDDGEKKPTYGFNRNRVAPQAEEDDEERWKKLREL